MFRRKKGTEIELRFRLSGSREIKRYGRLVRNPHPQVILEKPEMIIPVLPKADPKGESTHEDYEPEMTSRDEGKTFYPFFYVENDRIVRSNATIASPLSPLTDASTIQHDRMRNSMDRMLKRVKETKEILMYILIGIMVGYAVNVIISPYLPPPGVGGGTPLPPTTVTP